MEVCKNTAKRLCMVQSRRDVERGLWYSGKIGVIFLVSRNPDRNTDTSFGKFRLKHCEIRATAQN